MKWNVLGAVAGILFFVGLMIVFSIVVNVIWIDYEPNFFISLIGIIVASVVGGFVYNNIKDYGHSHGGSEEDDKKFENATNKIRWAIAGIIIIFLIGTVVFDYFTEGPGSNTIDNINNANNSNTETFNKSGVSFNYSSDWEVNEDSNSSFIATLVNMAVNNTDFLIFTVNSEGITLDEFKNAFIRENSSDYRVLNISDTSVSGLDAIDVYVNKSGNYSRSVSFVKGDSIYNLILRSNDLSELNADDMIFKTFRFT
ncbi:PsbP-related protein [Methanobrevibacter filiformis]|nr:PsbP-related protein [Methanobrevibacter filiformis]